jgi:hypothetical protein
MHRSLFLLFLGFCGTTSATFAHVAPAGENGEKGKAGLKKPEARIVESSVLLDSKGKARLQEAFLDSAEFTDEDLKWLRNIANIGSLYLASDKFTDNGLQHIAVHDQLVSLDIISTKITTRGLKHLAKLDGLRHLGVYSVPRSGITFREPEDWARIWRIPQNKDVHVSFGCAEFTDADLKALLDFPNITLFDVESDMITDDGLQYLAQLDRLKWLYLRSTKVTGRGFSHLAKLKGLRRVYLFCPAITDAALRDLERMSELEDVSIIHRTLSDEAIARFKKNRPKLSTQFQEFSELLHGKVNRLTVTPQDDPISRLTKMRFNAALDVFELSWAGIQAGRALPALRGLVDAAIDLTDVPEKAIVLKGALDALREVTLINEAQKEAGKIGNEYATVLFEVRDLELRIVRASKSKGAAK